MIQKNERAGVPTGMPVVFLRQDKRHKDNNYTVYPPLNPDPQRKPSRRYTLNKFDYPQKEIIS